ncbi:MAG: sulfotransferase domain-containing protein [Acidimicrobiales bacterium]
MTDLIRYRSMISDSARWNGFPLRPGDIIISTPPKSGTTWMQMLCALLVFDDPDFGRPLSDISPWLDMLTLPLPIVVATLEAQQHRRFIKTHTPFDGLPLDERVTYLCIGRDPRDVGLSWDNHRANLDMESVMAARAAAVGLDDIADQGPPQPPPADVRDRFWAWAATEASPLANGTSLQSALHHLHTGWVRRQEPNVALFHYSDLCADLVGELGRLAVALGTRVAAERLAELSRAASFEQMRARSAELAPRGAKSHWHSSERFFDQGPARRWPDVLTPTDAARYERRVAALSDDHEFLAWVHGGWRAVSDR